GRASGWSNRFRSGGRGAVFVSYVAGLAATSLLAGLATAPIAAFHFNRAPHYGLIANLAAVPAMGFWVAPSALVATALAPFGLEGPALTAMGRGIEAILAVARFVAGLPGAVSPVPAGAPVVLTLIVFGGLALCLGRRALRLGGAALAAAGFALWSLGDARPTLLVAPEASLVGLRGEDGRALDRKRGQGYAARVWLQSDGDDADQETASARDGLSVDGKTTVARLGRERIFVDRSREPDAETLGIACADGGLLIVPGAATAPEGPCAFLGEEALLKLGALAFEVGEAGLEMRSAAEEAGDRRWTRSAAGAR
ncbi:MAG: ComEC/Rec2 family competence protein, partial [Pseudomonadota bacterium]